MSEHTPGPWAWDSRNGKHYLVTCAADASHGIVLGWPTGMEDGSWFTDDDFGAADSRLIAAAPELLAVAVEAENRFDNHGGEDDEGAQMLLAMFRAAIAKALGVDGGAVGEPKAEQPGKP